MTENTPSDALVEAMARAIDDRWNQLRACSPRDLALAAAAVIADALAAPVDMLLFCPKCGVQHVDEPGGQWDGQAWENPPHKSHLCHSCGCIWRPSDRPTNGVASLKTTGKADTWGADSFAELAERDARIRVLEEELHRIKQGQWFYLAGDMSSERCRFSPAEVIDEDWLYDNRGEGSHVIQIEVATPLPDIWCAVHFFTEEEKNARQSDDDYELTEHASEEEARAALGSAKV